MLEQGVQRVPKRNTRLTAILAKIQEKRGRRSLLHVNCVSTVDLQVIELASVEAEDVIHICQGRHHTSLCDRKKSSGLVLNVYTDDKESVPAIIPVKVQGETFWAYLDTGSGRNFISSDATKKLKLEPVRQEARQIVTINGSKEQSLPIYDPEIKSVDGKQVEIVEVTGSKMENLTTIKRPNIGVLKEKLEHSKINNSMLRKTTTT